MSESYNYAALRASAAKMCLNEKIVSSKASCVDVLANLIAHKLEVLGQEAKSNANAGHRTDINALDMSQAIMTHLSFSPDALRHFCVAQSANTNPMQIQRPVYQEVSVYEPPLLDSKSVQGQEHIPPPLPAFPPEHTYRSTPVIHRPSTAESVVQGPSGAMRARGNQLSVEAESALAEQVLTRAWRDSGVGVTSQALDELEQVRQKLPLFDR